MLQRRSSNYAFKRGESAVTTAPRGAWRHSCRPGVDTTHVAATMPRRKWLIYLWTHRNTHGNCGQATKETSPHFPRKYLGQCLALGVRASDPSVAETMQSRINSNATKLSWLTSMYYPSQGEPPRFRISRSRNTVDLYLVYGLVLTVTLSV
jgi:hypothetical protein